MILIEMTAMLFLIFCTVFDLRTKKIPLSVLVVFGMIILGMTGINGTLVHRGIYWQLIPGAVFLLIAFVTRQAVGYGDGIVILLVGILLGISRCLSMVCLGLVLCSAVSLGILLLKKGNRQTKLPFTPFLLVAEGVILLGR